MDEESEKLFDEIVNDFIDDEEDNFEDTFEEVYQQQLGKFKPVDKRTTQNNSPSLNSTTLSDYELEKLILG